MFDRTAACVKFCEGLDEGVLKRANEAEFTAKLLWDQRDRAFSHLAVQGLPIYDESGRVSDGHGIILEPVRK